MEDNKEQVTLLPNERPLIQSLTVGITKTGSVELTHIDRFGISLELKKYKLPNNSINYSALFDIPKEQRITALAKKDLRSTIGILSVAITLALETMNLKRGMNEFQILDLAEAIVDEAESDALSIEDILLFFQKLTRGEYLELYEGVDQSKIMQRLNSYRDERWEAGIAIRDAKIEEYKNLGDNNHFERNNPKDASPLGMQIEHFRKNIQERSDERKSRKQ